LNTFSELPSTNYCRDEDYFTVYVTANAINYYHNFTSHDSALCYVTSRLGQVRILEMSLYLATKMALDNEDADVPGKDLEDKIYS